MIISNSSPLIHLTRLGKIEYLLQLVGEILIPKAVYNETIIEGKKNNYSEAFVIENYINNGQVKIINLESFEESFYPPLGRGEIEALELAKQKKKLLLIDDKKARMLAQIFKIDNQTTIATIFELLLAQKIDFLEYKSNLKKYAENSWISADIIQEYIDRGEKIG